MADDNDYEFAETDKNMDNPAESPEKEVPETANDEKEDHSFTPAPEDAEEGGAEDDTVLSLSWMWGADNEADEQDVERMPNKHTGIDTILSISHLKGYLWKKKKDPATNAVLDANRWFVFDIKEGELDYFQSHEPNSRGSKALGLFQFNEIVHIDSHTFQIKTYFYNEQHRTRVQNLNLKASTEEECNAWVDTLEGARIRFLIEVTPLIRNVQKRVRGWLYRRHLKKKKGEKATELAKKKSVLIASTTMFFLALFFFTFGLCFTLTRDMDGNQGKCFGIVERISGIKDDPNVDWAISNVNNSYPAFGAGLNDYMKSPIIKLKVTHSDATSFANSLGNSFSSKISGISDYFGSSDATSASSTPLIYRPMNKTLQKEFMERVKDEAERTVPLVREEYGSLKDKLSAKVGMKYETDIITMDAFSGYDGVKYLGVDPTRDNRKNARALLRIKSKWFTTKADPDFVTLIIAVHTDDNLDCRITPRDWRCSLSASLMSEIETKALIEFRSERISVHHYGNPHASFFTLAFDVNRALRK